jgi:hypothetical protein
MFARDISIRPHISCAVREMTKASADDHSSTKFNRQADNSEPRWALVVMTFFTGGADSGEHFLATVRELHPVTQ